jgi:hypothetical protein
MAQRLRRAPMLRILHFPSWPTFTLLVCALVQQHCAEATSIFIENHSFENTVVPDGQYTVNLVPGWLGEGAWHHVANPTDAQFFGTTDGSSGPNPIHGRNVAAVNSYGHLIYQSLSATLLPNYTYTLRVLFGHRNGVPEDSSVNLIAGSRFLSRGFADTPPGTFTELTMVYHSPGSGDFIGLPIKIELRSAGDISQGWFDNVRLDATPSLTGTTPSIDTPYVPIPGDHPDYAGSGGQPWTGFVPFSDNGPLSPSKTSTPVPEGGSNLLWNALMMLAFAGVLVFRHRIA